MSTAGGALSTVRRAVPAVCSDEEEPCDAPPHRMRKRDGLLLVEIAVIGGWRAWSARCRRIDSLSRVPPCSRHSARSELAGAPLPPRDRRRSACRLAGPRTSGATALRPGVGG